MPGVMDPAKIKSSQRIRLRPNPLLPDPDQLRVYQRRMSLMMLVRPRMVVGDDVGLGKTIETIAALTYILAANPHYRVLVLAEKIAIAQWGEEFDKWAPDIKYRIVTQERYPKREQRVRAFSSNERSVIITTYSMVYNFQGAIRTGLGKDWVLVADEPNYFKNPDTRLHQAMFNLANSETGCRRAYGLTATIIENRLDEAFGILRVIAPGTFESLPAFYRDFCRTRKLRRRTVIVGHKNLKQFRKRIEPVFWGRLADDPEVDQELPEVITKDVNVQLGEAQSRKLLEAMDKIIEMPDGEVRRLQILPALIMATQLANDPRMLGFDIVGEKTKALLEMLTGSLAGQKVMVYSKLRRTIYQVEVDLKKAKIPYGRITGKEDQDERDRVRRSFQQEKGGVEVILGTKAIQKSMNLQRGAHLFYYDLPWSYGIYRQIRGRLRRAGSSHTRIAVYHLLAQLHPTVASLAGGDESIDHYTLDTVLKKQALWKAVTGDQESLATTDSELVEIFNAIKAARKAPAAMSGTV